MTSYRIRSSPAGGGLSQWRRGCGVTTAEAIKRDLQTTGGKLARAVHSCRVLITAAGIGWQKLLPRAQKCGCLAFDTSYGAVWNIALRIRVGEKRKTDFGSVLAGRCFDRFAVFNRLDGSCL